MGRRSSLNEAKVIDYVRQNGEMTTADGINLLGVSESTIRRIFIGLQKEGTVQRVFGGIKAVSQEGRYRYKETAVINVAEKKQIGAAASRLVRDKEFIYIDGGTTTLEMSKALARRLEEREIREVTVITNSVVNLDILARYCDVIIAGGKYSEDRKDVSGNLSETFLSQFRFNKTFLGTDGFTFEEGFTSSSVNVSLLSKKASQLAEKTYVLMDSTKIGKQSFGISCRLENIDGIVIDSKIDETSRKRFEENSVQVFKFDESE
ncbi:DeoR/GlpR family DNA-binding transcription regulator [Anaerostipes sp.]|uniref:DeoR/GlpR family DNA-binding transcription regulator n=1 Tax=Anaerostipes sp. TaxID=1872530 RepID=UPI0025BF8B3E|nr:DeoR/GlpR family DNA-binding transcription regulator [Anaerostipes sp.]MBS7009847.1 DeoR/GlpR transcriptional regulator [Anaerostipes sp.]